MSRMSNKEIAAELARIERELIASAAKCQASTKEAMRVIDQILLDLGCPLAKGQADGM
jgi:hypothetical protein